MPAGAPPSSSGPCSSRVVALSAPIAMPSPPPTPPVVAVAEDEKRPLLPMKMKMLFSKAVYFMFGSMGRTCGMAMLGVHIVICVIKVLSFATDPEVARFWIPIFRAWVYLGLAAIVLMACQWICYHMPVYGVYAVNDNTPQQQPAAAAAVAVQLPPPPPEMDTC